MKTKFSMLEFFPIQRTFSLVRRQSPKAKICGKSALLHLHYGPVSREREREREEKSPAPDRIKTHDLLILGLITTNLSKSNLKFD